MTQNDLRLAVIAINNALATNNPKGLTQALRKAGHFGDSRYDILGHDALTKMLMEVYTDSPRTWGNIVQSVPFDYQRTDSSTSPETKSLFMNIARSADPSSASAKFAVPDWFNYTLGLIIGSTTTVAPTPPVAAAAIPTWGYIAITVIVLAIIAIVWWALKQKSI